MNCPSCDSNNIRTVFHNSNKHICKDCDCVWLTKRVFDKILEDPRLTTHELARAIPPGQPCPFEHSCFEDAEKRSMAIGPAHTNLYQMESNCPTRHNLEHWKNIGTMDEPERFVCSDYKYCQEHLAG